VEGLVAKPNTLPPPTCPESLAQPAVHMPDTHVPEQPSPAPPPTGQQGSFGSPHWVHLSAMQPTPVPAQRGPGAASGQHASFAPPHALHIVPMHARPLAQSSIPVMSQHAWPALPHIGSLQTPETHERPAVGQRAAPVPAQQG
jgi:hypothetical protein